MSDQLYCPECENELKYFCNGDYYCSKCDKTFSKEQCKNEYEVIGNSNGYSFENLEF